MNLKKTESGNYSFRWRVPSIDRDLFNGKTEIVKSLKTKNAKIANRKAKHLKVGLSILRERLSNMTNRDVDKIVKEWLDERLDADLNGRIYKSNLQGAKSLPYTKTLENTQDNLRDLQKELGELKTSMVADIGASLINSDIDENEPSHQRLLFQLLRANVQLFKTLTERNEGIIDFNICSLSDIDNKLTYKEALKEYLPNLLEQSIIKARNHISDGEEPKQYIENKKFYLEKFLPVIGEENLLPERSSECTSLLNKSFTRDCGTVARDVQERIKAFYTWLFEENLIPTHIAKRFYFESVPKSKRKAFTPEMVNTILTTTTGDTNLLFRIYLHSGMRRSEFFDSTFDEALQGFTITKGKNKNAVRFIPQHPSIEDIDAKTIARLQSAWNPDKAGRMLNNWINVHISKESKYSLHSTRHCFNTWMRSAGIPSNTIKAIMGHEDNEDDMTDYYTTYFENEGDIKHAVKSVDYSIS